MNKSLGSLAERVAPERRRMFCVMKEVLISRRKRSVISLFVIKRNESFQGRERETRRGALGKSAEEFRDREMKVQPSERLQERNERPLTRMLVT